MNKCPKCERQLNSVTINNIDVNALPGPSWRGIAYNCPHCHVIISVAIDPVALKNDIINGVVARLKQ